MFDLDKWQEIFATIRKNKLRTALTALSVAWGIFILIVLLAAGQGLRNGAESQFASDASNSLWIDGGQTSVPYAGYKPGRTIQLTNDDYNYIKTKINGVDVASAVYKGWDAKILSYKNEHASFTVRSCAPGHNVLERARITSGRFINLNDFNQFRKVCVIGEPVQKTLFGKENPLGKMIDVGGTVFTVIGTFFDPGKGDNDRIYIPLLTAQKMNNGKNHVNVIWASTGTVSIERSEQMVTEVRNYFSKKYNFHPDDRSAISVYNNNVEYKRIMNLLEGIKVFILFIGAFTLIAGIVGVSNIMMIIVKERTREIGVRKAIGATPASIVWLILQESVFITFVAGFTGMIAGLLLIEGVKWFGVEGDFFRNPDVDVKTAAFSVITIIVAGALAGFFPALKAANVEPITALREE